MSIPPTPPSTAPARGLGFRGRVTRGMRSTRGRTQPSGGQQGAPAPPGGGTPAPPGGGTSAPPGGGTSTPPPDPNNDARTGEKRGPSSPMLRDVDAAKKARTEADSIPAQTLTLKKPKSYHLSKAEIAGDEKSTKVRELSFVFFLPRLISIHHLSLPSKPTSVHCGCYHPRIRYCQHPPRW